MSSKITESFNNNKYSTINVRYEVINEKLEESMSQQASEIKLIKEHLLNINNKIENSLILKLKLEIESLKQENILLREEIFFVRDKLINNKKDKSNG